MKKIVALTVELEDGTSERMEGVGWYHRTDTHGWVEQQDHTKTQVPVSYIAAQISLQEASGG